MKKYIKVFVVLLAIAILLAGIAWGIYAAFGEKVFEFSFIIKVIAELIR